MFRGLSTDVSPRWLARLDPARVAARASLASGVLLFAALCARSDGSFLLAQIIGCCAEKLKPFEPLLERIQAVYVPCSFSSQCRPALAVTSVGCFSPL